MKNSRTCVIWLTHRLDDRALEEFKRLESECRNEFDCLVLYDNSRQDFQRPADFPHSRFEMFELPMLDERFRLNRLRNPVSLTPGNTVFPLLDFSIRHRHSYYWMIEYDVRYTGSWLEFFTQFNRNGSDLLGTTMFRHAFRPSWCWWKTLRTPRFTLSRKKNWVRGLFPVMRISEKGVRTYIKAHKKGWRGHYEVCMPTVLKHYGLTIEDIGGDGEFVQTANTNRHYTNNPSVDGLAPGTFVCPPATPETQRVSNKLYHAVK